VDAKTPPPPTTPPRRVVRIEEILRDAREVVLLHAGQEYLLRITRNGKLILTK
jgi:hemin uptake protein HemP